jgi:hypothetical protein
VLTEKTVDLVEMVKVELVPLVTTVTTDLKVNQVLKAVMLVCHQWARLETDLLVKKVPLVHLVIKVLEVKRVMPVRVA